MCMHSVRVEQVCGGPVGDDGNGKVCLWQGGGLIFPLGIFFVCLYPSTSIHQRLLAGKNFSYAVPLF